jgi:L-ascorbate metabolism protein UlaG (beta-lactamase superfamily)
MMNMKFIVLMLVAAIAAPHITAEPEVPLDSTKEARMHQLKSIKQKKKYRNYLDFDMMADGAFWGSLKEWITSDNISEPKEKLDFRPVHPDSIFSGRGDRLKAVWLGHSSFIIEIDGLRIMLDPVLYNNVSPVFFYSVKRFQKASPISAEDLPWMDAVVISHDHFDHLQKKTIKNIHHKVNRFIIPTGIDKYLKKWGVPTEKITVLDWSESTTIGQVSITALPAQHFSGRGFFRGNKTLWASFALAGPHHKLYYSGDTGYHTFFKRIGEAHGPFDLVILDTGQYGKYWPRVHMFPHESVQAHLDLKGKAYLPVHWGSFNLSTHNWYDPIEGAVAEAEKIGVEIAIPYPGGTITIGEELPKRQWWREPAVP